MLMLKKTEWRKVAGGRVAEWQGGRVAAQTELGGEAGHTRGSVSWTKNSPSQITNVAGMDYP